MLFTNCTGTIVLFSPSKKINLGYNLIYSIMSLDRDMSKFVVHHDVSHSIFFRLIFYGMARGVQNNRGSSTIIYAEPASVIIMQ